MANTRVKGDTRVRDLVLKKLGTRWADALREADERRFFSCTKKHIVQVGTGSAVKETLGQLYLVCKPCVEAWNKPNGEAWKWKRSKLKTQLEEEELQELLTEVSGLSPPVKWDEMAKKAERVALRKMKREARELKALPKGRRGQNRVGEKKVEADRMELKSSPATVSFSSQSTSVSKRPRRLTPPIIVVSDSEAHEPSESTIILTSSDEDELSDHTIILTSSDEDDKVADHKGKGKMLRKRSKSPPSACGSKKRRL
ncbi:hypothetical protein DFH11DRAFT_1542984 [Phellopilus nigrolimitatus]|nr:hypothetical protein DFH11DRAFT_1548730 [Phellopilus nigrolimitatus]KAH8115485.1 hypothetical protein DFH11DRAFT_1542984 [Phellopilus nigrolimitatus]